MKPTFAYELAQRAIANYHIIKKKKTIKKKLSRR